jgi:hypothetical protein
VASENHIFKLSNAGGFKALTRYPDMLAGNTVWNPWEPQGAYDALATVTVGATAVSSITFAGIPTGYKHLQIRALYLNSSSYSNVQMQFNGDTGSNYSWHELYGDGSAVGATAYTSQTNIRPILGAVGTTNQAVGIIDILDYASVSKNKTTRSLSGADTNGGTNYVLSRSGLWMNSSSAISSIVFTAQAGNFNQYSQFALYGVK